VLKLVSGALYTISAGMIYWQIEIAGQVTGYFELQRLREVVENYLNST